MTRKKKLDDLMEAVTFAEAGEIDHARRLASEIFPPSGERIVALSTSRGFSVKMVEKSLAMAERLGYGLVALSVPSTLAKWVPGLGERRGRGGPRITIEAFRARAAEMGIPFTQAAKVDDPERAVAVVRRKFRRIAFLLVDGDLRSKSRFAGVNLPIFLVADR